MESLDDSEWIIPSKKILNKDFTYTKSFDETISIIKRILSEYDVFSAFLYGSYARKNNHFNDIDILIICKKNMALSDFQEIKTRLFKQLNYPVDLVGMIYFGKPVEYDDKCKYFIEDNVFIDAIPIFHQSKEIILECQYVGKV